MGLLSKILGKSQLNEKVEQLEQEIEINLNEKTDLLQKIKHLQNKIINLQEQNSSLDYSNRELSRQLKELNNKLHKAHQQIEDSEKKLTLLSNYKATYGEIIIENNQSNTRPISDLDEDSSFFEFLLPKNGNNPFNTDQINAIRYDMEKHLRIIAGAGSGKTQTICAKAAYLNMMQNVPEKKIAMITFTNKAAEEMKNRVNEFTNNHKSEIQVATFNGMFRRLYNELEKEFPYINSLGINGDSPDKGEREYNRLLSTMINKYGLKKLNESGEKNLFERIGYWTNMGFNVDEMCEFIKKHYDELETESSEPLSERFRNMMDEVNKIRKEKDIFIYNDQLTNLLNVLKTDESSKKFVQNKFDYIFIDEFQDTNPLQMKILQLICPPNSNDTAKLIIVGDDDQSIYFFRGAEPKYIKNFDEIYDTHTTTLMTNYRSTTKIVQAGNRVITANKGDRIEKAMKPFHKNEGDCYIKKLTNPEEEAVWIINKITDVGYKSEPFKDQRNTPNFRNSVVLYRSSGQLKSLLSELENQQLPYVIDSKEDILGIFNIDLFKRDFHLWKSFMESDIYDEKKQAWNNIIERTGFLFYKKNSEMKQLINGSSGFITEKVAADFVCKPKNKKFINDTENFLKELIKIKNDPTRSLTKFIKLYLSFPRPENDIILDDANWIQKEFDSIRNWDELINKYENLLKKKKDMKDQLFAYHNGELNAIYLLTIHKSKGLSFHNVFLIGLYNDGLPHKKAVMKKKVDTKELIEKADPPTTIEEERRLMYVAVTRPKKNLYITFPKMLNNKPCKRSIFLKELGLPIK